MLYSVAAVLHGCPALREQNRNLVHPLLTLQANKRQNFFSYIAGEGPSDGGGSVGRHPRCSEVDIPVSIPVFTAMYMYVCMYDCLASANTLNSLPAGGKMNTMSIKVLMTQFASAGGDVHIRRPNVKSNRRKQNTQSSRWKALRSAWMYIAQF